MDEADRKWWESEGVYAFMRILPDNKMQDLMKIAMVRYDALPSTLKGMFGHLQANGVFIDLGRLRREVQDRMQRTQDSEEASDASPGLKE